MSSTFKNIVFYVICGVLILGITIAAIPLITFMLKPEFREWLENFVAQAGIWGILFLLLIQILQIAIAFIPGEPIELVAGVMYGAMGGLVICLSGILISSSLVFYIVRKLGRDRLSRTSLYPKIMEYSFLQKEEKLLAIVFLLYLIPGTPKDILVYICALTPISMKTFLLVSTFARIPSIITSTMAGAAFYNGNFALMIGIFALTAILGIGGIIFHNKKFKS